MSVRTPSAAATGTSSRFEAYGSIFGYAYTFLAVNMLLILANAPLAFLLQTIVDVWAVWPLMLAAALTIGPSLMGAFAAFRDLSQAGVTPRPVRAFVNGYRRGFAKSAVVSTATGAVVLLVAVDVVVVAQARQFVVLLPLMGLAGVAAVALAVTTLAAAEARPDVRLGTLARACLYVCVRRWYLSAVAVVLVGMIAAIVLVQPVLGMALAVAPLLFVVWSNAVFALTTAGVLPGRESA